jgi:3-dehydroquinate synthase
VTGDKARVGRIVRRLTVDLGNRSYPIEIGVGTLAGAGRAIQRCAPSSRAFVITVPPVSRRYGGILQRSLRGAGYRVRRIAVPDGDVSKNPRQLAKLWDELIRFGADRTTPIIALGGGVVGDLAGFAAASFLRGVPFVQIPTTLLAMVDASIGGKVAVNLPQGKNLVGAFYQPRLVWIDIATLESLPPRQRAAGFAEVVKAGAIWDRKLFERLERDAERLMVLDAKVLIPAIERACAIKAEIVSRDEREAGLRQILNFGHTLGHAIEKLGRYRELLHGEAVAIGMLVAARRSEALGLAPPGTAERIGNLTARLGLPSALPEYPRSAYLDALKVDKKMANRRISFVALRGIGKAETVALTPAEVLPAATRRGKPKRKPGGPTGRATARGRRRGVKDRA